MRQKKYDEYDAKDIKAVLNYYLNYIKLWLASPLRDTPFRAAGCYYEDEIPGGCLRVSGLSALIDALVEDLPEDLIKLNAEVSEVAMVDGEVAISIVGGVCYVASQVIMTCSLGYLKENVRKMFKPSLPAKKLAAIDKIGFGKIGKVFLQYKRPFWTKGSGRMSLAWTDEDWKRKDDTEWYKNIEAFDEVVDNGDVLVCWVANEGVDAMETMPEEQLKVSCTAVLRKFLHNPTIPLPVNITRTNWASDRLYRGAYCYEGHDTTDEHWKDLEEAVMEKDIPRVLFAGEAMRGNGCMTGARDSALREAEKLLKFYGLQNVLTI